MEVNFPLVLFAFVCATDPQKKPVRSMGNCHWCHLDTELCEHCVTWCENAIQDAKRHLQRIQQNMIITIVSKDKQWTHCLCVKPHFKDDNSHSQLSYIMWNVMYFKCYRKYILKVFWIFLIKKTQTKNVLNEFIFYCTIQPHCNMIIYPLISNYLFVHIQHDI